MIETLSYHRTISDWLIAKHLAYIPALLIGLDPQSYLILTIFMGLDLILGVTRSVILHGAQSFKSYKLTAGVVSKLLILSVPLIVVWAGRGAGFDLTILGQWAVGILVLSQAYSMLGHINAIRLRQEATEWDAVSWLIRRLRNALEVIIVDGHNEEKV